MVVLNCRAILELPPFHGGNTSSNLVRDAKEIRELRDFLATLSNICPIYGRGCGWTPVDMEEAIEGAKQRCRRPRVSSIEAPTGIAGDGKVQVLHEPNAG